MSHNHFYLLFTNIKSLKENLGFVFLFFEYEIGNLLLIFKTACLELSVNSLLFSGRIFLEV